MTLFHGGAASLWPGHIIKPNMSHTRYFDGCSQCEAQRLNLNIEGFDPITPHGFVYATLDREYARYYASRAGKGWLYEVRLADDAEPSTEDPFPTWRASAATVVRVNEKRITLTMDERQQLFIRWGGTEAEFKSMVSKLEIDAIFRRSR